MKYLHRSPIPAWFAALLLLAIVVSLVCCSATKALAYPATTQVSSVTTPVPDPHVAEIARLRKALAMSPAAKWRWRYLSLKRKWTRSDLRWAITYAGGDQWLENAAVDIVFDGAAESHGNNRCVYGQHVGMFQWNNAWKGTRAQKMRGTWSVRRFVKVYRDGGQAAIRKHWAATLGR